MSRWLLIATCVCVGCGARDGLTVSQAEGIPDAQQAQGIPEAQISDDLHRAACQQEVQCGLMPDVNTCVAATRSPVSAQLMRDLASGKVVYEPADGKALANWIAGVPCGIMSKGSVMVLVPMPFG
jgi:hypothetical protein